MTNKKIQKICARRSPEWQTAEDAKKAQMDRLNNMIKKIEEIERIVFGYKITNKSV